MMRFNSTASCTFVFFSSAEGNPRSANTFPELGVAFLFMLAIFCLVVFPRKLQSACYQLNVGLSRFDTTRRFLPERMQYVNRVAEPHSVDRPVRVSPGIPNNLQDSRPFTLPGFGLGM